MSKKLLFVVNVDWFFLSHRLPIALAAQKAGFEVHVALGITDKSSVLESFGLRVHPLSLERSGLGLLNAIRAIFQLRRIFMQVRPDLVHLVTIKPVLLGGLVARWLKLPAVISAIAGLGFVFVAKGWVARLRRWVVIRLYSLALGHRNQVVIFQNSNDRDTLMAATGLPECKVLMIRGSGVDLDQYVVNPLPPNERIVLLASRLLYDKGVAEFVQAARLLRSRNLNSAIKWRFILVGRPDMANPASVSNNQLKAWVDEGAVEHWGYRDDMPVVLSAASVVVLPSYYGEGLPKVLIEAAACGRAVVTTDHPGCRDAIVPGVSGVLVPIRNAEALAAAIQDLLEKPEKCAAMGAAGRKLAEYEFSIKQVVDAHLQIYNRLATRALQ